MGDTNLIKESARRLWTNPSLFMPFILQVVATAACFALALAAYLVCKNFGIDEDPANIVSVVVGGIMLIASNVFLYATFIGMVNSNEKGLNLRYGSKFFWRILFFGIFFLIYILLSAVISFLTVLLMLRASTHYAFASISYEHLPGLLAIFIGLAIFPLLTPAYIVLENCSMLKAVKKSFVNVFRNYLEFLIKLIVALIIMFIVLLILAIPFFIAGVMAAQESQTSMIIIASVFGVIASMLATPYLSTYLYLFAANKKEK